MEPPTIGAHLQKFIFALQWVHQGIPNFTKLVAPLHYFMERVYAAAENIRKVPSLDLCLHHSYGSNKKTDRSQPSNRHSPNRLLWLTVTSRNVYEFIRTLLTLFCTVFLLKYRTRTRKNGFRKTFTSRFRFCPAVSTAPKWVGPSWRNRPSP